MQKPVHPGLIVKHDCIEALGLQVNEAAERLDVSRAALSRMLNGKAAISAEMAIRLENVFGSSAETWLRMQLAYDLATTREALAQRTRPSAAH